MPSFPMSIVRPSMHHASMDVIPHNTKTSPLWWRCVRYVVTAVTSLCVVAIVWSVCWIRFSGQQVSLRFTDPNFFSDVTLSPIRLTAGVILPETAPPLSSFRFVNPSFRIIVVSKRDLRTVRPRSSTSAARFGIEWECNPRRRAFWFYVRTSILATAFCLAGLSHLIFAAHFRRFRRDPSTALSFTAADPVPPRSASATPTAESANPYRRSLTADASNIAKFKRRYDADF